MGCSANGRRRRIYRIERGVTHKKKIDGCRANHDEILNTLLAITLMSAESHRSVLLHSKAPNSMLFSHYTKEFKHTASPARTETIRRTGSVCKTKAQRLCFQSFQKGIVTDFRQYSKWRSTAAWLEQVIWNSSHMPCKWTRRSTKSTRIACYTVLCCLSKRNTTQMIQFIKCD